LDRARQTLEPEDRLILRMRFEDSMSVADIARGLHRDQKRLYRTIERLFATLRERLEADGISRDEIASLFKAGLIDDGDNDTESGSAVPSTRDAGPTSPPPAAMGIGGRRG